MEPVILAVSGSSPMIASEVIDLPQPDSPTRPMVSPSRTVKETLSTIRVSPKRAGKRMERFLTSRMTFGSPAPVSRLASRSVRRDSVSESSASSPRRRSSAAVSTAGLAALAAAVSEVEALFLVDLGFTRASVMPSARMFSASTVSRIVRPAKVVAHQAPLSTRVRP